MLPRARQNTQDMAASALMEFTGQWSANPQPLITGCVSWESCLISKSLSFLIYNTEF